MSIAPLQAKHRPATSRSVQGGTPTPPLDQGQSVLDFHSGPGYTITPLSDVSHDLIFLALAKGLLGRNYLRSRRGCRGGNVKFSANHHNKVAPRRGTGAR